MFGDQMRAAARRSQLEARLEAEGLEFLLEDLPDRSHSGSVVRAAVDVDDPLEERERFSVVSIDGPGDRSLRNREGLRGCGGGEDCGENCGGDERSH
jgi:hypothetical protein